MILAAVTRSENDGGGEDRAYGADRGLAHAVNHCAASDLRHSAPVEQPPSGCCKTVAASSFAGPRYRLKATTLPRSGPPDRMLRTLAFHVPSALDHRRIPTRSARDPPVLRRREIVKMKPSAAVIFASAAVTISACGTGATQGEVATSRDVRPPNGNQTQTAGGHVSRERRPAPVPKRIQLARPPIVVAFLGAGDSQPSYTVYVRLRGGFRPTRKRRLLVRLEGLSNFDTSGLGVDAQEDARCYAKGIDNFKQFPSALRHPRLGDLLRVSIGATPAATR